MGSRKVGIWEGLFLVLLLVLVAVNGIMDFLPGTWQALGVNTAAALRLGSFVLVLVAGFVVVYRYFYRLFLDRLDPRSLGFDAFSPRDVAQLSAFFVTALLWGTLVAIVAHLL